MRRGKTFNVDPWQAPRLRKCDRCDRDAARGWHVYDGKRKVATVKGCYKHLRELDREFVKATAVPAPEFDWFS